MFNATLYRLPPDFAHIWGMGGGGGGGGYVAQSVERATHEFPSGWFGDSIMWGAETDIMISTLCLPVV